MSILNTMLELNASPEAQDGTPDPSVLLAKAQQPASVLAVDSGIRYHAQHCPTAKAMRKMIVIGAFALGIFAVVQVWATAYVHSAVTEMRDAAKGKHAVTGGIIVPSAMAGEAKR